VMFTRGNEDTIVGDAIFAQHLPTHGDGISGTRARQQRLSRVERVSGLHKVHCVNCRVITNLVVRLDLSS
jgi:hypothetical protein